MRAVAMIGILGLLGLICVVTLGSKVHSHLERRESVHSQSLVDGQFQFRIGSNRRVECNDGSGKWASISDLTVVQIAAAKVNGLYEVFAIAEANQHNHVFCTVQISRGRSSWGQPWPDPETGLGQPWVQVGDVTAKEIALGADDRGELHLVAIETGNPPHMPPDTFVDYVYGGETWRGRSWKRIGGVTAAAIAVKSKPIEIYAKGTDDIIYHAVRAGDTFGLGTPWTKVDKESAVPNTPAVVSASVGFRPAPIVTTHHNDNRRSGANLVEISLKPTNVGSDSFGKLFELPVVGSIYAQPLFVPNLRLGNQSRNVLYVATMHNQAYAFDADSGELLWQRRLAESIQLPDSEIGNDNNNIEWEVGILSTPVIDTSRNAIYLVSTSKRQETSYVHQVWMLDLTTGNDRRPPTTISGSVGNAVFASERQLQRSALLLSQNTIYVPFASYGDKAPYHGWVFSFDADTLAPRDTFCSTPRGNLGRGGIWMSGAGPAADDSGNLYLMTSNGDFNPAVGNFGECVLKLDSSLNVVDFFAPHDQLRGDEDQDLGSGGVLAIPGTNLLMGGGKKAILYLMDMGNLGKDTDRALDRVEASVIDGDHHIHGSPVFWSGPDGLRIYIWTEKDQCKAFHLVGNTVDHNHVEQTTVSDPRHFPGGADGMPGGFLSVSANGNQDGILWGTHPWEDDLNAKIGEGVLRAFDARTLGQLWGEVYGNFAKFCPPTIANGRVYVATMGGLSAKRLAGARAFFGPAMINRGDSDLVLGWTGTDSPARHLNIIFSSDGINWHDPYTIPETTSGPLALVFDGAEPPGRTFIAWTGTDKGKHLYINSSVDQLLHNWNNKHPVGETSKLGLGPALHIFKNRLFIAWTGPDGSLNVKSSGDLGASWQGRQTLDGERSLAGPTLAVFNSKLIILWTGTDQRLNFSESDDGITWKNKVTLFETSHDHAAMEIGLGNVPYLCWSDSGNDRLSLLHSEDGTTRGFGVSPNFKRTFYDTGFGGVCLCAFRKKMFVGWTGTDADNNVNVAQLSRGAVAVYGLLP
jgi:outer membrane protein assembly factor BamB